MERRRSRRLQEKEIEEIEAMGSLSIHDPAEPIIQDSPIFDPEIFKVLPKIINNLDPRSFVRFARTCKEMNSFCFSSKEIQIPYWGVGRRRNAYVKAHERGPLRLALIVNGRDHLADSEFGKKVLKMPFVFKVEVFLEGFEMMVDDMLLANIRRSLSIFPHVVISCLKSSSRFIHWEALVEFVKDYTVELFCAWATEIPPEILPFITQNVTELDYDAYYIPDDVILSATTKILHTREAKISKETFKELIKKFVASDMKEWGIGRERAIDGEPDPFIDAVSEVMETVLVLRPERFNRRVMEPSTAYFKPAEPDQFYLLKSDGSLGFFTVRPHYVVFFVVDRPFFFSHK